MASESPATTRRQLPTNLGDLMNGAVRVFGCPLRPDIDAFVRKQAAKYLRELRKLAVTAKAGATKQARGRSFELEHSFAGRFCALLLSYPKGARLLTLHQAVVKAEEVVTRRPTHEPIKATVHAKPEGGVRTTFSFGVGDRAAKRLVDDMLRVTNAPNPYEFSCRGRGRDAAIRTVLKAFEKGGVQRLVRIDLENFFPSHRRAAMLHGINLPRSVVENVVLIHREKIIYAPHTSSNPARSGLPQGSRPSSFLASKTAETLLTALPHARLALCHGDDLLVGVRTDEEAEDVKSTLASRCAEHPAGPFVMKEVEVMKLGKDHDFLGYQFRYRDQHFGGGARASASRKAITRFQRKLAAGLVTLTSGELDVAEEKITRWVKSFGAWGAGENAVTIGLIDASFEVLPLVSQFRALARHQKPSFRLLSDVARAFNAMFGRHVGRMTPLNYVPASGIKAVIGRHQSSGLKTTD